MRDQERNSSENSHCKDTAFYQRYFLCYVLALSEHKVLKELHVLLVIPYLNSANGWYQLFNQLVKERF